jgi:integrase
MGVGAVAVSRLTESRRSEIEPRELEEEEIKRLLEEAKKREPEAKFLLELETFKRVGMSIHDETSFEIVYGNADVYELDYRRIDERTIGARYIIVPRTVPTIVLERHEYEDINKSQRSFTVHVFDGKGWKRIDVSPDKYNL